MNHIIVEVNPQIELMNSILYTSDHGQIVKDLMGFNPVIDIETDYTNAVRDFFERYRSHDVYRIVETMTRDGFFLGRPMELMCSVGRPPAFERKYPVSELCTQLCGGEENIDTLLNALRDFSRQIGYMDFSSVVECRYGDLIEAAKKHIDRYPFVSLMENFYGKKQNSYHYIITNLSHGSFGICFLNDGRYDMFSVMTLFNVSDSEEENEQSRGGAIDQCNHSRVCPSVDQSFDGTIQRSGR